MTFFLCARLAILLKDTPLFQASAKAMSLQSPLSRGETTGTANCAGFLIGGRYSGITSVSQSPTRLQSYAPPFS